MKETALLVIDVQVGMFAEEEPVYQGDTLLANIGSLLEKARQAEIPIIYVQHGEDNGPLVEDTPLWQIHPAIQPQEGDTLIRKRTPDSFHKTNLQQELEARGIKKLVLTGLQTEMCVDTTCRRAVSLGYDVTLVTDAHSTWNSGELSAAQIIAHHNNTLRWFGTPKQTNEVTFN